jgi:hypothetical protein
MRDGRVLVPCRDRERRPIEGPSAGVAREEPRRLEVADGRRQRVVPAPGLAEEVQVEVLEGQVLAEEREEPRGAEHVLPGGEGDAGGLEHLECRSERADEAEGRGVARSRPMS